MTPHVGEKEQSHDCAVVVVPGNVDDRHFTNYYQAACRCRWKSAVCVTWAHAKSEAAAHVWDGYGVPV